MRNALKEAPSIKQLFKELHNDKKEYMILLSFLIIAVLLGSISIKLFIEILPGIREGSFSSFDNYMFDVIHSFRTDTVTEVIMVITNLGNTKAYAILIPLIALILYYHGHRWKLSIQASVILSTSFIFNVVIKKLIARPRPLEEWRLIDATFYSFPSGHSTSAMAFYGFLIFLSIKYISNRPIKVLLSIFLGLLILLIGVSRIYLGVHYASDVIAGFTVGLVWLVISVIIFRAIEYYRKSKL